MKLGLALSGGGVRAAVFHCGVLQRLALDRAFEEMTFLSTVSGGSLVVGLIFCKNEHRWPTSEEYLGLVLPLVRSCLTTANLQWSYGWRSFVLPWRLLQGRADLLANQLEKQWGIYGTLQDLELAPRWVVNSTCYETGRNWQFSQKRMGDYVANYVLEPKVNIADAISASAAVPGLIGPLTIRSTDFNWHEYKNGTPTPVNLLTKRYELWDGGVYDNLGIEPLYKPSGGFREGIDFMLVSDASALFRKPPQKINRRGMTRRLVRLINVAKDQIRGLRARALVNHFERNPGTGAYFRFGNTVEDIYNAVGASSISKDTLEETRVNQIREFATTLRRLSTEEFDLLLQHGFEVANATLATRLSDKFKYKKLPRIN